MEERRDIGIHTKRFIGKPYEYSKGNLQIGDDCIIHPAYDSFNNISSQAKISYPVRVVLSYIHWDNGGQWEICIEGRGNNKWAGAVLNEYAFSRLEKV